MNKYRLLSICAIAVISLWGCSSDSSKNDTSSDVSTCEPGDDSCSHSTVCDTDTACGSSCIDCTQTGMICGGGKCVCPANTVLCGDRCVSESDSVCGSSCLNCEALGMICQNHTCDCQQNMHLCATGCVEAGNESCGETCTDCTAQGMICNGVQCDCPDGRIVCGGQCVEESDTACGKYCTDCTSIGLECHNGACGCLPGMNMCGGRCVEESDKLCGAGCIDCTEFGLECHDGACSCLPGMVLCGGACIEETDEVCGVGCTDCTALGLECHSGKCTCPDGMAKCEDTCIPETDQVCGDSCTDCSHLGLECINGECVCPNDEVMCNGTCTPQSDTSCGSECTKCLEMGSICQNGQCACTPHELEYAIFQNQIEDLELLLPEYAGESRIGAITKDFVTTATNALPYHRFEVIAASSPQTVIEYRGTTRNGERLALFVYKPSVQQWTKLDSGIVLENAPIELHAAVSNADVVLNGKIQVMVAPELQSNGTDSILMTGDTQNYTSPDYYINGESNGIYNVIMEYVKEQYLNKKIAYFHHVGDMASNNSGNDPAQFEKESRIVSEAQQIIDAENIPNGISVGNHDNHVVTTHQDNYVRPWYDKYFPYTRYSSNFWYGGHYDNNYNSYTLITIANRDFVFLNLGFQSYPFEWANYVLNLYSHRIAIVCVHSYLGKEASFTLEGKTVYNYFVAPYSNVLMVLAGHTGVVDYNIRTVDESSDRRIYEIIVDHTGLEPLPGGMGSAGYLRWITFKDNQIINKTYSPYRDKWRTASDGKGEEWTENLVLPDSVREIQTLAFNAYSKCECADKGDCAETEECRDGVCVCASDMLMCNGSCVKESDDACGTGCLDCASAHASCESGTCVCPVGQLPVYGMDGTWKGCTEQCGNSTCGNGAVCIDSGTSQRCRCGVDGDICELGGTCADRVCDCDESLQFAVSTGTSLGCILPADAPSKLPSQITMSIAKNTNENLSAMVFNWVTTPDTIDSELVYSTDPSLVNPSRVQAGVQKPTFEQMIPDTNPELFTPVYAYAAIASDLTPGMTYYYKLGNATDGYSEIRSFVARPAASSTDDFSFLVMPGTKISKEYSFLTVARDLFLYLATHEADADFLMHLGDALAQGYNSSQWQYYLDTIQPLAKIMPIMAMVGKYDGGRNRDARFLHFLTRFNYSSLSFARIPGAAAGTIYSFEYGNALIIVLNSSAYNNDFKVEWETFVNDAVSKTNKKWKIVFVHVPPYSPGPHYTVDNAHGLILSQNDIDLVISGYERNYYRTTLHTLGGDTNRTDQIIRVSPENGAGTTYVVAGTARSAYESSAFQGILAAEKDTSFGSVSYNSIIGTYGKVSVTDDAIRYTAYDFGNGSIVDDFSIQKTRRAFNDANKNTISRIGLSGLPVVGNTLVSTHTPADAAVSWKWERSADLKNWSVIAGATASTYTIQSGDENHYIRCTATGTGSIKGSAVSLPTLMVKRSP